MTNMEKLIEGIRPVLPEITEEQIKRTWFLNCELCPISRYCDRCFFLMKDGEFILDEDGEKVVNPDMDCGDISAKWMSEEWNG